MDARMHLEAEAPSGTCAAAPDLHGALQDAAARYAEATAHRRALEALLPDPVLLLRDLEVLDANPAALRMLGAADLAAAKGRSVLEAVAPESRDRLARLLSTGAVRPVQLELHDGRRVWLEGRRTRVPSQRGQADLWVLRDVGSVLADQRTLQAHDARTAALLGEAGFTVALDEEGRVVEWTDAAEARTGCRRAQAFWSPLPSLFEDAAAARGLLADARRDGRAEAALHLRKDDRPVRVLLTRQEEGLLLIVRETEQSAHEGAQQQSVGQVEEAEHRMHALAHDLQAPLTTMRGFCGLLEGHREDLPAEARRHVAAISEGAERMAALVQGVMRWARAGGMLQREPVHLEEVLDDVREDLRLSVVETQAKITCGPLPVVQADRAQMVQLLQNLVANALKFRSGRPPRVHVEAHREGATWRIEVQDNGIGLPPGQEEEAFTMFRRLHPVEGIPGSGAGLAICRRIVEAHGGAITMQRRDDGTTVAFTLPATPRAVAREPQIAARREARPRKAL